MMIINDFYELKGDFIIELEHAVQDSHFIDIDS